MYGTENVDLCETEYLHFSTSMAIPMAWKEERTCGKSEHVNQAVVYRARGQIDTSLPSFIPQTLPHCHMSVSGYWHTATVNRLGFSNFGLGLYLDG